MTKLTSKMLRFVLIFVVGVLAVAALPDPSAAQTGCEPACSGYPANKQSLSCACRAVCDRLICPAGTTAPSFIESKSCPPGPSTPAHTVSRVCCTGKNGRIRCKAFPSCKSMSRS